MSEEKKAKVKFSFKNLTKWQKVLFIVAIVVATTAVALAIALPLTLGNKAVEPYFLRFDQNSDSQVTLVWNAVRGASAYRVEYYFEGEEHVFSDVTGTRFYIDRKAGVLYARVMPHVGDKSAFSEYVRQEIDMLTLAAPSVSLSERGVAEWTNVYFKYRGERLAVENYDVQLKVGDGEFFSIGEREGNSVDLAALIVGSVFYEEGLEEQGIEWTDVEVSVRVRPCVDVNPVYTPTKQELFLKGAYREGDFGTASLTVTKEIYEEMKV